MSDSERLGPMIFSPQGFQGLVVAPHHLAARAGLRVLDEGGDAVEAMIAAASTIAVVYPHMNGLGGDNFWLIHEPGCEPVGIDACGGAAGCADPAYYQAAGFEAVPARGPMAALTVAGTVSGWQAARQHSFRRWGGKLPLHRLLEDAVHYARNGFPVSQTQSDNTREKSAELKSLPGFASVNLPDGIPPSPGECFRQPVLAATLENLSHNGLDDFYRGEVGSESARDLASVGSPLTMSDLERHKPLRVAPLSLPLNGDRLFNMPPPTQGLASLLLLGIYDRLGVQQAESFDFAHGLIESTKQAFRIRDRFITDPAYMSVNPVDFLREEALRDMAAQVDRQKAAVWPATQNAGDTVWLGAADRSGRVVSFIQSLYWEFGCVVVLPRTGVTWQNRGSSFSLNPKHHNCLKPFRRPFHTIQPALAHLSDGRVMAYGTMGGEGQPQTQAMIFSRYVRYGQNLQQAVSAPRWLLGRTWGSEVTNLRIENRFDTELYEQLKQAGHDLEVIGAYDGVMGHAGAVVVCPDGLMEGASDPRCDGAAAAL